MDVQTLAAAIAVCKRRGEQDSAAILSTIAPAYSSSSTYHVGDFCNFNGKLYRCNTEITTGEVFNSFHWDEHSIDYYLSRADELISKPRFGVKGVGGSSATLTRLWDAVGKTATPSTDTVQGSSDFDNYAPFNRRKCVGNWTAENGKARFNVQAYYGDADYAEDGTMGDYVAVEIKPFYYYDDGDIIGVSEQEFPGWKIHPVCIDLDGNVRAYTYIPVYALAQKSSKAVSLPGYQNQRGGYKDLWDYAATYDNSAVSDYAILEPSAVDHYEWLLMTIEFATQNMQGIMNGAVSMRYNTNDVIVATPAANKIVIGSGGSGFVVGQTICINTGHDTSVDISLYNCITAIAKCDADGTLNDSGSYYLITYDGTDRTSSITVDSWKVGSRPWITGATAGYAESVNAVLGHTGSPVSNSNGIYPMRYRWRENVYGNQNMTAMDLANVRVEDGTVDEETIYHLDWYHLVDPRKMSTHVNFELSTLQDPTKGWVRLGAETPSSSYVNGYVKELGFDAQYPHVKVPVLTNGGGSGTYYCDYASLVNSNVVRAVRRRGYVSYGALAGPRFFYASNGVSNASWPYGGGLFFIQ